MESGERLKFKRSNMALRSVDRFTQWLEQESQSEWNTNGNREISARS